MTISKWLACSTARRQPDLRRSIFAGVIYPEPYELIRKIGGSSVGPFDGPSGYWVLELFFLRDVLLRFICIRPWTANKIVLSTTSRE